MSEAQLNPIQSAIVEMKLMTAKFDALDKTMSSFVADMKANQEKTAHQARQDYEYLDDKIDKKCHESTEIARAALKKVDDHLLLTKNDQDHKRSGIDWARWLPSMVFGAIGTIILIVNNWRKP